MERPILLGCMLFFFILAACSSETAVELVHTDVEIITDKEKTGAIIITSGTEKEKELVPTALYYEFTIKNIGNKKIKNIDDQHLEIKIQPHDSLIKASRDVIGFNIFDLDNYEDSGLGSGLTYATSIEREQEEKFSVFYELGVSEENPDVSLLVPSNAKLKDLSSHALEATLIISMSDKEIARFDMKQ